MKQQGGLSRDGEEAGLNWVIGNGLGKGIPRTEDFLVDQAWSGNRGTFDLYAMTFWTYTRLYSEIRTGFKHSLFLHY